MLKRTNGKAETTKDDTKFQRNGIKRKKASRKNKEHGRKGKSSTRKRTKARRGHNIDGV